MDLYEYWRDFTHMPEIMPYLERVTVLDSDRSHWVAKVAGGQSVEWNARLTEDDPGRAISWESEPGADMTSSGSVRFSPAPADKGTEVVVEMGYDPPGGKLGDIVSKLFGENPAQVVTEGLRCFKRRMETGEIPTIEGQPRGTCGKGRKS
jgi:uncharacterized membrane protein